MPIGLQLWTVRDALAEDVEGTLARVGELGFDGVELFDTHGRTPDQLRAVLDAAGLVAAGRHASLDALEDDLAPLAAELRTLGTDRLALAWIEPPTEPPAADELVARLVAISARVGAEGLNFAFHNHWGELAPLDGGATFLDRLLALEPGVVDLELDLGWIWESGSDPSELLARAAGRCPLVHVKDFTERGARAHAPVGDGIVGYEAVVPAARAAGADWLIVEQDEADGSPFDAAARSLAAVRRFDVQRPGA